MAESQDPDSLPTEHLSGMGDVLPASAPARLSDSAFEGMLGARSQQNGAGWQRSLERFVAIKILPPGLVHGEVDFAARFKREAKAMARLKHPGIIPVHDAGETPDGLLYFVMDFIEGTDVQKLIAARGRLPPEEALPIITRVLDALAYAHQHGIIHRDIKPANIIVDEEGQMHVADVPLGEPSTSATVRATTKVSVVSSRPLGLHHSEPISS